MAGKIEQKLKALNIVLPNAAAPVANYIAYTRCGPMVFIAGQICQTDGKPVCVGKAGGAIDLATAQRAARVCALNILAVLKSACDGDLDRVVRCLRLGGFVNAAPGFTDVPLVVNGASDLMVGALGEAGKHARTTIGVPVLPGDVCVEVDAIFEVA